MSVRCARYADILSKELGVVRRVLRLQEVSKQLKPQYATSLIICRLSLICEESRDDCVFIGCNFFRKQSAISFLGVLQQCDVAMHGNLYANSLRKGRRLHII